jgi:hypothetical protein
MKKKQRKSYTAAFKVKISRLENGAAAIHLIFAEFCLDNGEASMSRPLRWL